MPLTTTLLSRQTTLSSCHIKFDTMCWNVMPKAKLNTFRVLHSYQIWIAKCIKMRKKKLHVAQGIFDLVNYTDVLTRNLCFLSNSITDWSAMYCLFMYRLSEVGKWRKFGFAVSCYSYDVIQVQRTNDGIVHRSLMISVCAVYLLFFLLTMFKFWISFPNSHACEQLFYKMMTYLRQNARPVDKTLQRPSF